MINKNQYTVDSNKKLLHKIGKHWVTVSIAMIALLGGSIVASHTTTHADSTNQPNNDTAAKPAVKTSNNTVSNDDVTVKNQLNDKLNSAYQNNQKTTQTQPTTPTEIESQAKKNVRVLMASAKPTANVSKQNDNRSTNTPAPAQQSQKNDKPINAHKPFSPAMQQYLNSPAGKAGSKALNQENNNNQNKPVIKHNIGDTNYFTGATHTGTDDGLNYTAYANGGVEFTGGTAQSDLSKFSYNDNTSDVTNQDVHNAKAIKFDDDINISNVTNMGSMFGSDTSLQSINFGKNFDTSHVTNMSDMFISLNATDPNLKQINIISPNTKFQSMSISLLNPPRWINSANPNQILTELDDGKSHVGDWIRAVPVTDKIIYSGAPSADNMTVTGSSNTTNRVFAPDGYYFTDGKDSEPVVFNGKTYTFNVGSTTAPITDTIHFHDIATDGHVAPSDKKVTGMYDESYTVNPTSQVLSNDGNTYTQKWAIVNSDGMPIKLNQIPYRNGNQTFDVLPIYDGLTYKYDSKTKTVEFVGGTAQSDLSNFASELPTYTPGNNDNNFPIMLRYASHIKFDNDVDMSHVTNMSNMFAGGSYIQTLDLGNNFNTSNVTNMNNMFSNMYSLTSLNFRPRFNTSKVTDMGSMFSEDNSLQTLNLGNNFDTSNVTNMSNMFSNASSLTSLNFGDKFSTSKVTNMDSMFYFDYSLKSLILPKSFDTSNVTDMNNMLNMGWFTPQLALTIQSPKTKIASDAGQFYSAFTYHGKVLKDKNGKPYTYKDPMKDLSKGKAGTYTNYSNSPEHYDGLYYAYIPSDNSTVFFAGTANPNNHRFEIAQAEHSDDSGNFLGGSSGSDIVKSNTIKFSSDVDVSKLTNMSDMFGDDNSVGYGHDFFGNHNNQLHIIDLGDNFNTSNTTNMHRMFANDSDLNTIIFSPNFDTSKVDDMSDMFGLSHENAENDNQTVYTVNPSIQKIVIKSPKTKIHNDFDKSKDSDTYIGIFYKQTLGKDSNGKPYTLPMSNDFTKGNVGTFVKNRNVPTDTIDYMYNGKQLATKSFNGLNYVNSEKNDYRNLTNQDFTSIPSGFQFTGNNNIAIDGGTYQVNIEPIQETDKIYYTDPDGNQIPGTSEVSITGNSSVASKYASDTFTTDSQFASNHKLPTKYSKYHLVNPNEVINYDGNKHNVIITPASVSGTVTLHLIYNETNGSVDSSDTKRIPLTIDDGKAKVISPWNPAYLKDNYRVTSQPITINSTNITKNPNYTFTYTGKTAEITIAYVDVSSDAQNDPKYNGQTAKFKEKSYPVVGHQAIKNAGIVGQIVNLAASNSGTPNALNVLNAPSGFYFVHNSDNNRMLRVPLTRSLMKFTLMMPRFNRKSNTKPKVVVKPNKPSVQPKPVVHPTVTPSSSSVTPVQSSAAKPNDSNIAKPNVASEPQPNHASNIKIIPSDSSTKPSVRAKNNHSSIARGLNIKDSAKAENQPNQTKHDVRANRNDIHNYGFKRSKRNEAIRTAKINPRRSLHLASIKHSTHVHNASTSPRFASKRNMRLPQTSDDDISSIASVIMLLLGISLAGVDTEKHQLS